MGKPPNQNQTRNVVKAQLNDGDAKDGDGNDDKNVEFDEYE